MADTWTPISGYTPQDYTDTAVFEVNSDTKKIALITGQALVAGEENSQYIKFVLDRYWDGIDIKDKAFYVEYALAGTYYGKTAAVNAEYTTEQVRFGWIVPKEACCISGTLLFVLRIESTDYVLKTQIAEHPVFKSVNVEDVVPEPTKEAWYREFEARVETAIEDAETALTAAQTAQVAAENAALNAQTAEENAETAAAMAQTRYGSPLTAAEADEMIEQNRVYVYVGSETGYTNGHWYYYNGTAWTDGGVYNGSAVNTDTTLTQSGMAADAKATGDEISQIKEDLSEYEGIFTADVDESVQNWLDEHPEATTTVQDGSLTKEKLTDNLKDQIISTDINSIKVSACKILNFSDLGVLGFEFQCCTYDSGRNNYIFVFTDNTNAKIVTITDDFETTNTYDVLNAYHANDITYCGPLDKLYLATMTNNILEINPYDMSVVSSIDIGERIAQISYDADNDVMYLGNTDTNTVIYKYNTSFERIESYSEFTWQSLYNLLGLTADQNLVGQSLCNVGGNLYLVAYTWDSGREINLAGYIILIGNSGNYGAKFSTAFAGEEPESLMLKNNTGLLSSWRKLGTAGSQLILYNASLSKKFVFNNDPYFRGIALHDIDLNDVLVPDNYFSKNTTTTSTITNAPVATSFTLFVRAQGYNNIRQILFADAANKIFTRVIYPQTGYIEKWYEIVFSNAITPTKQTFVNNGITFTFAYNAYMVGISATGSFTNATTTSWVTLGTAPISSMPMFALHTDNNTEVLVRINGENLQYITKSAVAQGSWFTDAASAFR